MSYSGASSRNLALGVGIAGATFILYRTINNYLYWNAKFIWAGKVGALYIYPVKSLKGIKTEYLDCGIRGCTHSGNKDRNFVIIDASHGNNFLTARTYPKMVLLEANVDENNILTISDSMDEHIQVDLQLIVKKNDVRRAKLHNNAETDGLDCGDEVGEFVTNALNVRGKRQLRVLYFQTDLFTERDFASEPWYWNNPVPIVQDHIAYADLASYMALTSASIEDLNAHLALKGESNIDERNFRPNLVITNSIPFDEDRWLHIRIGDEAELVCYKPCTRCILTTVNPDNGQKHPKMEPLKELRNYRSAPKGKLLGKYQTSPIFGVNLALVKPGRIKVGDDVFVQYKPTPY